MNRIKYIFIILLAVSVVCAQNETPPEGSQPKDFNIPEKTTTTLDNGLQVTMVHYGNLPKVNVRLVVRAGNINEQADQVWLADMTADYLKEGTESRDAMKIAEQAAGMGGEVSIGTGMDRTTVSGEVLSEFGPELIALLSDIIRNPAFPESELERLKNNFLRNLSVQKSRPGNLAMEKFREVLYGEHPYGRIFPTESMIQSYTMDDIKNFYKENFNAKRTHVYVVGVFDESEMLGAMRKQLGDWREGQPAQELMPSPQAGKAVYLIDRPDAPQSTIIMGLPVIDPSHEDYLALQLTNTLLGGFFSSRITANIREDKGYTYSPRSSVSSRFKDAYWTQQADVTTAVTGASLKEIFYEIDHLQNEAPSEEELKGVQNYLAGIFVLRNSSRSGIIGQLSFVDLHGLPDDYLNTYVQKIYQITPEEVQRIAKTYIDEDKISVVIVGDIKKIRNQVAPYGELVL